MARQTLRFNSREDWLEARKMGIGASDVATIVGLNPYDTPYLLWRRKLGIDPPKEMSDKMQAGHYLEDAVSLFFQDRTGHQIIKASAPDFMYVDADKSFLRVSPDRTYWMAGATHSEDNKCILECKTTQRDIDENDVPKTWLCQLMMNLGVAGFKKGSIAWLVRGYSFGYRELDFVPDFYKYLVEEVERFWVDNILGKQEPAPIDIKDVIAKYAKHTDSKYIEATTDIFNDYTELKAIREQLDALEKIKKEKEETIKMFLGDAEGLTCEGKTLCTWKAPKESQKLNVEALKADMPDVVEKYTEPYQGSRRFLVK